MFANSLTSTCINNIYVNVLSRTADVEFTSGDTYHYENLSFMALMKYALMSDSDSYGKWVNKYLLNTPFSEGVDVQFVGNSTLTA